MTLLARARGCLRQHKSEAGTAPVSASSASSSSTSATPIHHSCCIYRHTSTPSAPLVRPPRLRLLRHTQATLHSTALSHPPPKWGPSSLPSPLAYAALLLLRFLDTIADSLRTVHGRRQRHPRCLPGHHPWHRRRLPHDRQLHCCCLQRHLLLWSAQTNDDKQGLVPAGPRPGAAQARAGLRQQSQHRRLADC